MKKLSILLIGLLLVSGLAVAQPEVTLTGSATATFGVDLDTQATGISNAISLGTFVTWFDETQSTEGDGVYGMIELNGMRFAITDGAWSLRASRVTAKIMADPLFVQIYGDAGVGTAYDESVDQANVNARVGLLSNVSGVVSNAYASEFMGIAIGATLDVATVTLYVQSEADWTDNSDGDATTAADAVNTANAYAMGVAASISAVENLSLFLEADYGVNYATSPIGFGAALGYDVALDDTFTVSPNAGFDLVTVGGAMDYEADFGVNVSWPGMSGWGYHPSAGWGNYYSGFGVSAIYSVVADVADMGVQITTFEVATEGLVETVGWALETEIYGLLGTPDLGFKAYIDADVDPAYVYFIPEVGTALTALTYEMTLGADLSLIPNTTFGLKWDSGELLTAQELGVLTFSTKISL